MQGDDAEQTEEVAAPKKRGRPAKKLQEASGPAPKKRGRPAKTQEAASVPTPKKRGRPAKKAVVEPEPEPEQLEEDEEEAEEAEAEEEVAVAPTPKGILKNKHKAMPPAEETVVNGRSERQSSAQVEIKVTKKRGRPKKNQPDEDGLTDQEALAKGAATLKHDNIDPELQYWLMKAEPDSRIEKGVDVKFSIDDLYEKGEPEGWDGECQIPLLKISLLTIARRSKSRCSEQHASHARE